MELFNDFAKAMNEETACIYLGNGVKLKGVIHSHDESHLTLVRDGIAQLVSLRHIASIMPASAEGLYERRSNERGGL